MFKSIYRVHEDVNVFELLYHLQMYEFSQFMAMTGYLPEGSICTSNAIAILSANEEQGEVTVSGKCILWG